jgi:hypothetical protein
MQASSSGTSDETAHKGDALDKYRYRYVVIYLQVTTSSTSGETAHNGNASDRYGYRYWVATISRLLQIIGLFCEKALEKRRFSAKETYNLKEPTDRSHPICSYRDIYIQATNSGTAGETAHKGDVSYRCRDIDMYIQRYRYIYTCIYINL